MAAATASRPKVARSITDVETLNDLLEAHAVSFDDQHSHGQETVVRRQPDLRDRIPGVPVFYQMQCFQSTQTRVDLRVLNHAICVSIELAAISHREFDLA